MIRKNVTLVFLLLSILVKSQDWKWKNPLPTGNILNEVKFIDSTTIIAVGEQGTILKSTNKGLDWNVKISGTNVSLNSISVIDKDTIYVSGSDHSILKTINNGESWEKIFDGTGAKNGTNQVFFVTPAIGYLLGSSMQLFKTTDYGKTWIDLNVGLEFQNVPCIYFTSENVGYGVSGSALFIKTVDGGLTWSETYLPETSLYKSILFTDENTGYLIGISGTLLKTEDAGETWILNESLSQMAYFVALQSIEFINSEIGYVAGSKKIYKTYDSGNNWEEIYESGFDLFSISFSDFTDGIAVGGDWLYEVSGIIHTSDEGNTWNEASYTATTKYIDKIKFVDENTGYAVGGHVSATYSGYIMKTTNAGDTWTTLSTGTDTYWMSDIAIPSDNIIYVITWNGGQIFKSTDAGSTWTIQYSSITESFNAVQFIDNETGYVVGSSGTILKTVDGGITWVNIDYPIDITIETLYFEDANTGFIPYTDWNIDSTILLTTIDGGLNWDHKSIGTLHHPQGITFVNQDTAFIVGSFGGILRSFDGGINWEESYHNGNDYMDVFFTNGNTGYVVGDDGEISMTENCGDVWTVLNSRTDKQLRSIYFTDVNTGYVVGSDGVILKTTNSGSKLKALYQPYISACKNDTILLKPNFIGGKKPVTYLWDNNQTSSFINVIAINDTIYNVTIIDADQDSLRVEIPINVTFVPTPEISISGDTLISSEPYGNQWYKNDSIILGATSQKFIPEGIGYYYTIVTKNSCQSDESNILWFPLTINSIPPKDAFLYPNPSNEYIIIELNEYKEDYEIFIIDLDGKTILYQQANSEKTQIQLSGFKSGVYIVKIILEDKTLTKKIIKIYQ